ncbi:MAG: cyclic nucleotide-binding domain-containing protein, partial [Acidobacteria bacterium]|nr:cyclic nucleotide-binding domain-containing protein [Acidobacteriota bacterium]
MKYAASSAELAPNFEGGNHTIPSPPDLITRIGQRCIPLRVIRKGDWVFTQGQRIDCLYIIRDGSILMTRLSASGRETILGFAGPADSFGTVPLLNGGHAPFNARAVRKTTLLVVRKVDFNRLLEDPAVSRSLLTALAHRCTEAWDQIEVLGSGSIRERLHLVLS